LQPPPIAWYLMWGCASLIQVTRITDGKVYALKRVSIENMSQKELDDTLNEIRFLASFKHPRLVRWYETFLGESLRA
jgi:NIMA (never in mitosis gene a)-related kinase 1/4/5